MHVLTQPQPENENDLHYTCFNSCKLAPEDYLNHVPLSVWYPNSNQRWAWTVLILTWSCFLEKSILLLLYSLISNIFIHKECVLVLFIYLFFLSSGFPCLQTKHRTPQIVCKASCDAQNIAMSSIWPLPQHFKYSYGHNHQHVSLFALVAQEATNSTYESTMECTR